MAIILNHTVVPAHDKEASARFFAQVFGLKYEGSNGHFAPVRVNETLTFDFDTAQNFDFHHYAFHVSDEEFDAILKRVQGEGFHLAAILGTGRRRSMTGMAEGASILTTPMDTFSN